MSIATKTGDGGKTDAPGMRVSKNDPFVQLVGTLDELNATIGVACREEVYEAYTVPADAVQHRLLDIGAELYTGKELLSKADLGILDDFMAREEQPVRGFVIPEGRGAYWHLARAVCRRAERAMVDYELMGMDLQYRPRPLLKQYLNRLSDVLYVMATGKSVLRYWDNA
jgi:cob(I)alamin adenosyltransferase